MPPSPAAASSRPTVASQGHRSSSVSGVPAAILATFSTGWSESPSRNGTPSSRATRSPMVVFPQPETPMTMMRCFVITYSLPVFQSWLVLPVVDGAVDEAVVGQVGLMVGVGCGGFFVKFDADAWLVAGVQVAIHEGHG